MNPLRPIKIILAFLPFLLSILRDRHKWILFGSPQQLSDSRKKERAVTLTAKIASLGPAFIKGAQVLGMRDDLIPKLYTDELKKLQDQAPAFAFTRVRTIVKQEFDRTIEDAFERFEETPVAAASLGQVHRAGYKGKNVAVKILRPGIRKMVESDLKTVGILLIFLNYLFDNHYLRSMWIVFNEFKRMIKEEMDFKKEALNCERFRANFASNPDIIIPEVIEELCTEKIFVLEFHDGIRVDDIEGLKTLDIDPSALIQSLIEIYARQIVLDGFLHADPHPGNILINREGNIIIVDYGMALEIDEKSRKDILKIVVATVKGDINGIVSGFYTLGLVDPDINISQIKDVAEELISIQLTTDYGPRKIREIAEDILKTFYQFPLRVPSSLVYLFRAAALIEGIGISFNPHFNSLKAAMPVYRKIAREMWADPKLSPKEKILEKITDAFLFTENIFTVMKRAEREELAIRAHPADIMEIERFLRVALRRILLTIFAGGLAIISTLVYLKTGSELLLGVGFFFSTMIFIPLLILPLRRRIKLE